jgi:ABC-type lipopolysaccharide export system ATPase subunit
MIEARELTKRYGDTTAVHSLSFTIAPGTVTGFLGPNGAGKSTTMRMIMGLDRPTSGTVTVNGKPYRQHRAPLREVGALLEASAVHPGRSARSHLRSMAATHNIKAFRISEVIEMTGLAGVATKRAGELAAALAADGATVTSPEAGMLEVSGTTAEHVGEVAFRNGLLLHELSPRRASLEEAYMSLTQDAVEYRAHTTTTSRTAKAENQ